ncbi:alpha/beta-hydrolase [Aulographum hederae CBS 113979]|uniref:Carboxylic ester hydrolase n=1 Tax=Aulographum hederae CBS 113979 TaxID=1176131 RepID=A0A6G1HDS8_9PEZI|nr:alpha/beta-hydrolase [Aulographum hederae CBS 113979]
MFGQLALLSLLSLVSATPIAERQTGPSVTFSNGTIIGKTALGVDSFKGIPFAQQPVGPLRLKPPQAIASSLGTITSDDTPTSCPQFFSQINSPTLQDLPGDILGTVLNTPLFQTVLNEGEDCLSLNVQRPAGATSSSKLPVLFWIFGGGFEAGSTSIPPYDGTSIITRSVSMGQPIIFVAVNYRVGGFGFLAGKELAAEGSTNLGLRDQRLGMQWVQDNIEAFGGDPTKVTIWGESAGAISVYDHLAINNGDNTYKGNPLFRGAIMNSGSIVPALNVSSPPAQGIYDTVAEAAGCTGDGSLACLRSRDYTTFLNAVTSVPGIFSYRSLDLSYMPRPDPGNNFFSKSPEESLLSGAWAKVPLIIGDQEDEGTLFTVVLTNVTTNQAVIEYLNSYYPDVDTSFITDYVNLYPNDLGQSGSPFRTGIFNQIRPQYKRLAAILGDVSFTLSRRAFLSTAAQSVSSWSFLNTYLYGTSFLGTFHGTDVLYNFGYFGPLAPPTITTQTYYISFVNTLDPNALAGSLMDWPKWTGGDRRLLEFGALGPKGLITDDFRAAQGEFYRVNVTKFKI